MENAGWDDLSIGKKIHLLLHYGRGKRRARFGRARGDMDVRDGTLNVLH